MKHTPIAVAIAVAVSALAASSPAIAQSAKDKAKATALLKQGAALLEKKDYAEALERFQSAFAIVPSPKIHFNIGLAYEGLARPARAWDAFQKYLDGATSDAEERRADAKKHQEALRSAVAFLQVTSDTPGATVSVDGSEVGRTPLDHPIVLDPGAHQILVAEGGRTWTRSVRGEAGGSVSLDATLKEPPAPPPPLPTIATKPEEPSAEGPQRDVVVTERASSAESTPIYKKGWFWAAVGVVAVGAIVAVVAATRSTGSELNAACPDEFASNCIRF